MTANIYRQAALAKISNPDQLDQITQVVRPMHGIAFVVTTVFIVCGIGWSIITSAPIVVQASGLLLLPQGVTEVAAPAQGRLKELLVHRGKLVEKGQTIALIEQPDMLDRLDNKRAALQDTQNKLSMLEKMNRDYLAAQKKVIDDKQLSMREQVARLKDKRAVLIKRKESEDKLLKQGFIIDAAVFETESRIAQLENEISMTRNRLLETSSQLDSEIDLKKIELVSTRAQLAAQEREVEDLNREYERNRFVIAPIRGYVVEYGADEGDLVSAGMPLMRMLPDNEGKGSLQALVYVPGRDGKKVKPGMEVQIIPSTIRVQKDGFIFGTVIEVAELPATREAMIRQLRNQTLVNMLLQNGALVQASVVLQKRDESPSGYRWSSGDGPDISIDAGTMVRADVVVERVPIITLFLPAFEYVLSWLGIS